MKLSDVTTLRLGGPADEVVAVETADALVAAVREADASGQDVLIVGGGSNLVVADSGFAGRVVLVRTKGVEIVEDACSGAEVTVAAGDAWDEFVALAVERGWVGIEALSGIPGSVGATPIQNVGAYGQEIADTLVRVRTWDRLEDRQRTFSNSECGFGYRSSRFKSEPGRFVILDVTFQFQFGDRSAPIRYGELAERLGVQAGQRAPSREVREAVLELRRGKGMVLDAIDHDTWSAGSFFTNPILAPATAERLPAEAPRFQQGDGSVKTSAAWLIDRAGFAKGYGSKGVSISTKHTLALTNRGAGTTTDLLALAKEVRDGVFARFGVELVPEPVITGGIAWERLSAEEA